MGEAKGKAIVKGLGFCASAIGANVCSVDIDEDQGKILRIRPFRFDDEYDAATISTHGRSRRGGIRSSRASRCSAAPCRLGYKKRVYSKNRIPYPLKRVDWDPNGERNPATAARASTCASAGTRPPRSAPTRSSASTTSTGRSPSWCRATAMARRSSCTARTAARRVCSTWWETTRCRLASPTAGRAGTGARSMSGAWTRSASRTCRTT